MNPDESPGARLKAYIRALWTRKMGGDVALAKAAGIRRQTLQEWYADHSVPRLTELDVVAQALGVRRVDLVAAYDGVTAPDTTKEPPPEWAEALMTRDEVRLLVGQVQDTVTAEVRANREVIVAALAGEIGRRIGESLQDILTQLPDALARATGGREE